MSSVSTTPDRRRRRRYDLSDYIFIEEAALDDPKPRRRKAKRRYRTELELKELARKASVIRQLTGLPWKTIAKVLGERSHSQIYDLVNHRYGFL